MHHTEQNDNKHNKMIMKTVNNTAGSLGNYAPPKSSIITVTPEGILCSSIKELGDEFEFNPWGNIEG